MHGRYSFVQQSLFNRGDWSQLGIVVSILAVRARDMTSFLSPKVTPPESVARPGALHTRAGRKKVMISFYKNLCPSLLTHVTPEISLKP